MTGSVDGHVRTYDLRKGELRADYLGRESIISYSLILSRFHCLKSVCSLNSIPCNADPVTSIVPTQDAQTVLAATLDSHIRLMDLTTGKMLNDFQAHRNDSYRCRACFGHGEASVVCGDENGQVWACDLLDVSGCILEGLQLMGNVQASVLMPNPPPKVHDKVVSWVEHHPVEAGEMVTASADGTVKVWRHS